ncbi:hypothetical protein [Paenibacillus daejeonensis]|uniref:hypothetical protein n=1 Tax=Paenibacillus daejeonensis TaxID=135193 RepID=UPI0003695224|nr:hypothetical protein [Paenibacillus daejeonensis]
MKIKWLVLILLLLVLTASACTQEASDEVSDLYGTYRLEELLYRNPLSSQFGFQPSEETYTLTEDALIHTKEDGSVQQHTIAYPNETIDGQAFAEDFLIEVTGGLDLSTYPAYQRYVLKEPGRLNGYILYQADGELWLATTNAGQTPPDYYIWELHKLARQDSPERS